MLKNAAHTGVELGHLTVHQTVVMPHCRHPCIVLLQVNCAGLHDQADQIWHAVADERDHRSKAQWRQILLCQHQVYRKMNVWGAVDQRAVEIKDNTAHFGLCHLIEQPIEGI